MSAPPYAKRSRFLELKSLAALEHMRFSTRHRLEGTYSGRHRSRQQGGAGEFVDYRQYVGSEDLRRLDWKVLGRLGRAYVRIHQEETNLVATIALDASESMRFSGWGRGDGRGSKLRFAQYFATAISHIIGCGQDQVGLAVLDEGLRELVPPGGTASHIAHLQEIVESLSTRPARTMAGGLASLFERSSRRGLLLLISDFLCEDLEAAFAALRMFRHRGWEVVLLHLVHPVEESLPDGVAFRFEGMEGEGSVSCNPAELREAYRGRFSAHKQAVRRLASALGCEYREISTAVGYLHVLRHFLVERSG